MFSTDQNKLKKTPTPGTITPQSRLNLLAVREVIRDAWNWSGDSQAAVKEV